MDALFQAALEDMESLGASIVVVNLSEYVTDEEVLGGFTSGWSVLGPILDYECEAPLNEYFSTAGDGCPASLNELITFQTAYNDTKNPMNPARLDGFLSCAELSPTPQDAEFIRLTTEVVPAMESAMTDVMTQLGLSALVFPTMLCPATPTWYEEDPTWECETGDQWSPGYMANTMGWPEVSVPMGLTEVGAPVGMSIFGPKYSEPTLISFAFDYEQATMHRTPPPGFDALTGEEFSVAENSSGIALPLISCCFVTSVLTWFMLA